MSYYEPQGSEWITRMLIGGAILLVLFILFGQHLTKLI